MAKPKLKDAIKNLPAPKPKPKPKPPYKSAPGGMEKMPTFTTTKPVAADPYGALDGADRDAAVALTALFKSFGLESLAAQIIKMIQLGFSADTIAIELQETKEYKQRFAANDARIKAGLPVLSPAEYISTERAYRQVMSAAGLPVGFYDSVHDFQKFIEGDISPTEVKSRVDAVSEAIYKAPAATKDIFNQWYSTGDMIAYALDSKIASPLIEKRIRAAEAAALARQQGFALSQMSAERAGVTGSTLDQIQQGMGFVATEQKTTDKLGNMYGGAISTDDLVAEVFDKDSNAALKRRGLASRERGSFAGSSGQSKSTLGKESGI